MKTLIRRFCLVGSVLLGFTLGAVAQQVPAHDQFKIGIDCARFRGADDSTIHVEFYYAFSEGALTYRPDSAGLSGAADITLMVRAADSLIHADRWLVPHVVTDTSALRKHMNLVGLYAVGLPPGDYVVKVIARDRLNPSRADSVQLRLPIRVLEAGKPSTSDLEFASAIRQGSKGGMFYKNTLDVVPNVGGLYGEEQSCYYYLEAYNLLRGEDKSDYRIRSSIYDAVGKELMSRDRTRKRQAESTVIVDNFSVSALKSGTYTLVVSVLDSARLPMASTGKKFFVYNATLGLDSSLIASANSLPLPVYASMDESELDREFQLARYEAGSDEKKQFGELTGPDAKRKFLSSFWRRRSPGLRDEYLARAAYANVNFHMLGRDGFKSDRGRVYITYGAPDDYERHPNESESRPYEIWSYHNIQGGVVFIFVQRTASGDYELVHSTHRNELHDEDWERYINAR